MLATLIDRGLGERARTATGGRRQATAQLNVNYIVAAQIGTFVELHPKVERVGRSLIFMSGTVAAGEELIATAQGVWKILD